MTDPARRPPYPTSPNPAFWTGGRFDGHLASLVADGYDEAKYARPEQLALNTDWRALEDLTEGDPPGQLGFDLASAGTAGGRAPKRTQTLRGVVRRVSATLTGLILEEADEWLNVSRFSDGVDLAGYGAGDVVEVVVELGTNGKKYLHGVRRVEEPGA
jgi:hypothetical protein